MKYKITGFLIITTMILSMVGCALEQSADDNLHVTIDGFTTGNVTVVVYTANITEATSTNLTGIAGLNGLNVYEISIPAGGLVGVTETQTLTNKTFTTPVINSPNLTFPDITGAMDVEDIDATNQLDVTHSSTVYRFYRTSAVTNASRNVGEMIHKTTGDMSDGFGLNHTYKIEDNAGVENNIAAISAIRSGADNSGDLYFSTYSGGSPTYSLILTSAGNATFASNVYVTGEVSAESFTDRTKYFSGDAVSELIKIREKNGEIDHETLPDFTRTEKIIDTYSYITDSETGLTYRIKNGSEIVTERDIGATISMLCVAIKQLNERIEYLESKLK